MIKVEDQQLVSLRRAIENLPTEIKTKVISKALRSVTTAARTRLVRRQESRIKVSADVIKSLTSVSFNAGGNTQSIVVRSGWIPLYKLGALQTESGVEVRLRGSYKHAFLASLASGHNGVYRRVPGSRMKGKPWKEAIREQFGPNPAHDITNNDEVYLEVIAGVVEELLLPRSMREIMKVLPK